MRPGRWPGNGGEPGRDLAQQLVAGGVAERVVDHLEVVQVDVEHRHRAPAAARAGQRERQVLLELRAVGQAGERVVVGHVPHALLGDPLLGDVLTRDQHADAVARGHDAAGPRDVATRAGARDDRALRARVVQRDPGERGRERGPRGRAHVRGDGELEPVAADQLLLAVAEDLAAAAVDLQDQSRRVHDDDHRPGDVEVALRAAVLVGELHGAALAPTRLPDAHHRGEGQRHQQERRVLGRLPGDGGCGRGGHEHERGRRSPSSGRDRTSRRRSSAG